MPTTTSPLTTPRSGFVQPAFRSVIDTDALRPKGEGGGGEGVPFLVQRFMFAQIQLGTLPEPPHLSGDWVMRIELVLDMNRTGRPIHAKAENLSSDAYNRFATVDSTTVPLATGPRNKIARVVP